MIDIFNTPDSGNNVKVFYSTGTNAWQVWNKPKNCRFVNMFLIGGGGGGTGGSAAGSATVGGSGGGSSSITSGIFLACTLPDILYIQVGIGGNAGLGEINSNDGTDGGNGTLSYVSVFPSATTSSLISNTNPIVLASGNVAAGGARYDGSTSSIPGTAGTVFTQTTPLFNIFSYLGIITTIAGQEGGDGTYSSLNPPSNLNIVSITSGGAGGAGSFCSTLYNGASVIGFSQIPTISGGTTTNIKGNHGFTNLTQILNGNRLPLFFTGGAGGASVNSGTAGRGGNGSYGCGGGGGAGNVNSSVINTGGSGGRGGDGLVIITAW